MCSFPHLGTTELPGGEAGKCLYREAELVKILVVAAVVQWRIKL
jgi:hypothetical protein